MNDKIPLVSIGLAVFNGEKYLEQALDSILAQTFRDFELIISDNASSDRTKEICSQYAAQDPRIRYYRNSINIGGVNNETRTFELSRGKYFRLMAHDDLLAPELIAKSFEILEKNSEFVLCYSDISVIDGAGKQIKTIDTNIGEEDEPYQRFRRLVSREHRCEATYALTRSDVLTKVDPQLNYSDSDRAFLAQLSLFGKFYKIDEPLFYKRYHQERSIELYSDRYQRMAWFHPEIDENNLPYFCYFMYWRQIFHLLSIIYRSPINLKNKLFCYSRVVGWAKNIREKLITEVLILITKNPWLNQQ
ncbi:glycosyltransferase [Waterburya agarophytonicola K14]|uniref:Glycosyltransferase n=1 Tax=Waterburya agarophytonicola KI4 TaxID=2874699 RepID=A0A964BS04_9CYAN|nr:glycosyltransferase [Waterburya agarophytonicola]MCC0176765.1 glycosyltransferase [Waterburya agarophytonicola KI4]